jgi:hypothetical protein
LLARVAVTPGNLLPPALERGLKGWVERMRISPKVVIEGNILVKDHHHMFDGRGGRAASRQKTK